MSVNNKMVLINQYENLRKQIVMPTASFSIKGMGYAIILHKGMFEWCRICETQNEPDMPIPDFLTGLSGFL